MVCSQKGCPNEAIKGSKSCSVCRARHKRYNDNHKEEQAAWYKALSPQQKAERFARSLANREAIKKEVLAHYSPEGIAPMCSAIGCKVSNINMLTLDHVNNNGAEERNTQRGIVGANFYRKLKNVGFPNGYQTLCANHNLDKEIQRRRVKK